MPDRREVARSVESAPANGATVAGPSPSPPDLHRMVDRYPSLDRTQRAVVVEQMSNLPAQESEIARQLGALFRVEMSVELKTEIIDELVFLETPAAVDALLPGLGPGQPKQIREATVEGLVDVIEALGASDDPRAFLHIARAVHPQFPHEVRSAAISAMEDLGDTRGIPLLRQLLNDPDPEIREDAEFALAWLED